MADQVPGAVATPAEPQPGVVTPPAVPAVAAGPAIPWLEGADEVTVGYVQNKGWKEPKQVLEGYRNLEKLLGADRAGNTVVLPKPDAPKTEVDAFYERRGRPADPKDYTIKVPEKGGDPEFAKAAAAKFYELGLNRTQGEALAAWWTEHVTQGMTAHEQSRVDAYNADDLALKQTWGAAFTQELAKAQNAARALGVTPEMIDKLQTGMGHKATMEFFNKIGSKIGEAEFVSGAQGSAQFGAAMTPGQAQARMGELKADKNWTARYLSGDADAKAEMARLIAFAYPE